MDKGTLKILPLGGCGEIGMNMTILQVDDVHYFIDCGSLFPDSSQIGVELILPEITYLKDNAIRPHAWLITHGHEDHIGALPFIFPQFRAPLYASEFTIELIKEKFLEAGIQDAEFRLWEPGRTETLRALKVTPYTVNHSIADALGFFMETRHGNVLHTGDFRIDRIPPEKSQTHHNLQAVMGGKPIRLMLSDSTNAFVEGTDKSEDDLKAAFDHLMTHTPGTVVVTTFASNLWRHKSVIESALRTGRRIHLLGRSMRRNFDIGRRLGLMNTPLEAFVTEEELSTIPRRELCVLCTGSQGESFSGLSRLAYGSFDSVTLGHEDVAVFSSRSIPGNERSIGTIINQLYRIGCRVVTAKDMDVHVSGHGFQEDLKTTIRTANPEHFMPVHGEFRHLTKHIDLAIECGLAPEKCFLAENGDVVAAGPHAWGVIDRVASGRDFVCQGGTVQPSHGEHYKTRLAIGKNGLVCVSYVLPPEGFDLIAKPQFVNKGVPITDEHSLRRQLEGLYHDILETAQTRKDFSDHILSEELRIGLRRLLENRIHYKCVVVVLVQRTEV